MDGLHVVGDVLIGQSDELFLARGVHNVIDVALGRSQLSPESRSTLLANLVARKAYCDQADIQYLHLIAPEKYKVYPEGFPISGAPSLYDGFSDVAPEWCWYPSKELRSNPLGRSYYRNDTHWSIHGLLLIAQMIAGASGIETSNDIASRVLPNGEAPGDLGSKLEPKRLGPWFRFEAAPTTRLVENGLEHQAGPNAQNINDGRMFCAENPASVSDRTLLIFGDSYLYQGVTILAEFFRKVVLCRSRFMHREMIEMIRPDVVVTQMAERYMTKVSPDEGAPPFLFLPYALGRTPHIAPGDAVFISRFFAQGRTPDFRPFNI